MFQHPIFESTWVSIVTIVGFVIVLLLIKRIFFLYLRRWAAKTNFRWDDIVVRAFGLPATIVIIAAGTAIAQQLPILPESYHAMTSIAASFLLVLGIALLFDRLLTGLFIEYTVQNEQIRNYRGLVKSLLHALVGALALAFFLDSIGVSITPLIASLGVGSLAVALALQDTLANFFSGIYLLVDKPIQVGHYVQLASGEEGYVDHVGWRSVRIRRLQNNMVIIPNSQIANTILTNFYIPEREMSVLISLGVHYDSDLDKVEQVTCEVAQTVMQDVTGGVPSHEPFIRYKEFADSSINFTVILRCQEYVDQYLIKHEFIKRLNKRFNQEGIEIPYPIQNIYFKNELQTLNQAPNKPQN